MTRRIRSSHLFILALTLVASNAPAQQYQPSASNAPLEILAQDLRKGVACETSREKIFDAYYRAYSASGELPESSAFLGGSAAFRETALRAELESVHSLLTSRIKSAAKAMSFKAARGATEGEAPEREDDPLVHLARLEMRSEIETVYGEINRELDEKLTQARSLAREEGLGCEQTSAIESEALGRDPHAGDALYAARRTMATAYQSCQVLDLPPVTNRAPMVEGAERKVYVDGVGWGRVYTDFALLKRTHYYLREVRYAGSCVNQDKHPLIYDYGGVPKIASESSLNLFVNAGNGGPALGIDCSAFVSTAAASAGLRYQKEAPNRSVYTRFLSKDFVNAKKSKWNCYEQVKVTAQSTIRPGDIAAYPGHVVMVDSVGADPFGLRKITSASKCSTVNVKNFDFVLIQSSSSMDHLGINRYQASEYLQGGGHMKTLFVAHAYAACLSKFDHLEREPSTESEGLIRHRGTEACLAPRVSLVNEKCAESCAGL